MNLVTKSTDVLYLHGLKDFLEANGIPAVVNGENTARMITPFMMTAPSLWVYLDHQADEAKILVSDPDYVVINKVDIDEFYEIARKVSDDPKFLNTALIHFGIVMSLILLGMCILLGVFQWLGT